MVVRFGVVLIHKMRVVSTNQLHSILLGKLHQHLVRLLLQRERFSVCPDVGVLDLVSLQLKIVIVAEDSLIPLQRLTRSGNVAFQYFRRYFARNTSRTDDKVLVIAFKIFTVCTRTHIITVHPRT